MVAISDEEKCNCRWSTLPALFFFFGMWPSRRAMGSFGGETAVVILGHSALTCLPFSHAHLPAWSLRRLTCKLTLPFQQQAKTFEFCTFSLTISSSWCSCWKPEKDCFGPSKLTSDDCRWCCLRARDTLAKSLDSLAELTLPFEGLVFLPVRPVLTIHSFFVSLQTFGNSMFCSFYSSHRFCCAFMGSIASNRIHRLSFPL